LLTPQTPAGWILFAAMWAAGPITGVTASNLITFAWERKTVDRGDVMTVSLFGGLLAIATLMLMFVDGL
jgi:hypothetical protein